MSKEEAEYKELKALVEEQNKTLEKYFSALVKIHVKLNNLIDILVKAPVAEIIKHG